MIKTKTITIYYYFVFLNVSNTFWASIINDIYTEVNIRMMKKKICLRWITELPQKPTNNVGMNDFTNYFLLVNQLTINHIVPSNLNNSCKDNKI